MIWREQGTLEVPRYVYLLTILFIYLLLYAFLLTIVITAFIVFIITGSL